jgi:hypothetical protein
LALGCAHARLGLAIKGLRPYGPEVSRLRIPAALSVILLSGCGSHNAPRDAALADGSRDAKLRPIDAALADGSRDAKLCPIDAPSGSDGCESPCGDISGSTGLCHGAEVCVDPCGGCPPGCEPLV